MDNSVPVENKDNDIEYCILCGKEAGYVFQRT